MIGLKLNKYESDANWHDREFGICNPMWPLFSSVKFRVPLGMDPSTLSVGSDVGCVARLRALNNIYRGGGSVSVCIL